MTGALSFADINSQNVELLAPRVAMSTVFRSAAGDDGNGGQNTTFSPRFLCLGLNFEDHRFIASAADSSCSVTEG